MKSLLFTLCLGAGAAAAADLTISLPAVANISRKTVRYQCDAKGTGIGLPSGPFAVEYINAGDNSLAIVPLAGKPLIFVNVLSGSGARYTALQYTWWEAHNTVTVSATQAGVQSACRPVSSASR